MEIMEHSIKKKNIKSRNNLKQVDVRRSEQLPVASYKKSSVLYDNSVNYSDRRK